MPTLDIAALDQSRNPKWWSRRLSEIERFFNLLISERFKGHHKSLIEAKDFARQKHAGQVREGGGAYIIHPLRVAISLIRELEVSDPSIVVAALLHDTIEDSDCTAETLKEMFGEDVSKLIEVLTRQPDEQRPEQGDSLESTYFKRIAQSKKAITIKVADKLDNLRDAMYHPKRRKRQVLVTETERVYFPLLTALVNKEAEGRLKSLLTIAIENHSVCSLLRFLSEEAAKAEPGQEVVVPPACRDAALPYYLLFNPSLSCWLSDDGIRLTKTKLSLKNVVVNVAYKYADCIKSAGVKELLELAGIPTELANPGNQHEWKKAELQLRKLAQLLQERLIPDWCEPIFAPEATEWLLLIVHSLLFQPANWTFPMWQDDYGARLARNRKENPYAFTQSHSRVALYDKFLCFLLEKRGAISRFLNHTGKLERARAVVDTGTSLSSIDASILWSARLLSEYLDESLESAGSAQAGAVSGGGTPFWSSLKKMSPLPDVLACLEEVRRLETNDLTQSVAGSGIEFLGLTEVRNMFATSGHSKEFEHLLKLLISHCHSQRKDSVAWIAFEISEFGKRQELFAKDGGLSVKECSGFEDLETCGIRTIAEYAGQTFVLRVFPARHFALQNRLPELSQDDLDVFRAHGYSATAVFDWLIRERMQLERARTLDPVWVPRVYRILDTIEDLDSENVQGINVVLHGPDEIAHFRACLPLPIKSEPLEIQECRKKFVAQYIAAQIYNYGVTRRILSTTVECADIDDSRAACGFTDATLLALIKRTEDTFGFRSTYGGYIESFNFSPFRIQANGLSERNLLFGETDLRVGTFLGIDIGGTDVKFALFDKGEPAAQRTKYLGKIPTFTNKPVDAHEFSKGLISAIFDWFEEPQEICNRMLGIGISWPGAVRQNRIACISGTLAGLNHAEKSFSRDSSAAEIHSFPFLDIFRGELHDFATKNGFDLSPNLALIIENDGNAEAFGNYCSRVLDNKKKPGGKLILKLGTSLAGGRILPDSSIADDVAEFSKIVLNLNTKEDKEPQGVARDYVSSRGVRNLSRTFKFEDHLLFGCRNGANLESEEAKPTRIEAVELGELLDLWSAVPGQGEYLKELVRTDNHPSSHIVKRFAAHLEELLARDSLADRLTKYVYNRGKEWYARHPEEHPAADSANRVSPEIWQKGWSRTNWLSTDDSKPYADLPDSQKPESFPYGALAHKIVGSVALFSQLGLQIAHTIAALYNIYRRDSFSEVILAGGVLRGLTGELVKVQTEAFLLKYYDKIYGSDKSLRLDAIQLAQSNNKDLTGPLGAAMLANRQHKGARLSAMIKAVDFMVLRLAPGDQIGLVEVEKVLRERKIDAPAPEIRNYLYKKVTDSLLIPDEKNHDIFIRCIAFGS